jgi:hypothetical protein
MYTVLLRDVCQDQDLIMRWGADWRYKGVSFTSAAKYILHQGLIERVYTAESLFYLSQESHK